MTDYAKFVQTKKTLGYQEALVDILMKLGEEGEAGVREWIENNYPGGTKAAAAALEARA